MSEPFPCAATMPHRCERPSRFSHRYVKVSAIDAAIYSRQFLLVNLRLNIDRKLVFSYNCDNNSFVQFIESGGGTGPKKPGNLHVDM